MCRDKCQILTWMTGRQIQQQRYETQEEEQFWQGGEVEFKLSQRLPSGDFPQTILVWCLSVCLYKNNTYAHNSYEIGWTCL